MAETKNNVLQPPSQRFREMRFPEFRKGEWVDEDDSHERILTVKRWENLANYALAPQLPGLRIDQIRSRDIPSAIAMLIENAAKFPKLQSITLAGNRSNQSFGSEYEISICDLLEVYPGLQELSVRTDGEIEFRPIRHICLKWLDLWPRVATDSYLEPVVAICESVLPELARLNLRNVRGFYSDEGEIMHALLQGEAFPNLCELGLRGADFGIDYLIEILAQSRLIKQLTGLDISGEIFDEEADLILKQQEQFKSVPNLIFNEFVYPPSYDRYISEATIARLRKALGLTVSTIQMNRYRDEEPTNWPRFGD